MGKIGAAFGEWILGQAGSGLSIVRCERDLIRVKGDHATGEVIFHRFDGMPDVVELSVTEDATGEGVFFLHFELEDLERAQELFGEMRSVIVGVGDHRVRRVLLCCTTGMTTTMFAARLQEVANTLSLQYTFEAMALEDAKHTDLHFDAVMLAPQVGYQRREVRSHFEDIVIFEIPARVFGSYDATGCLRMLMGLMGDDTLANPDPTDLRLAREVKNNHEILLISVIAKPRLSAISWRIYDGFKLLAAEEVHKCRIDVNDLCDILATLHYRGIEIADIDAVGVALPGAVDYGSVSFGGHDLSEVNIEAAIGGRFGVRVFVDNNANAATVGCYVSTDAYDSVLLHTQQTGFLVGGEGAVANGHLLRGRKGMAGELGPLARRLFVDGCLHVPELEDMEASIGLVELRTDIAWRADRMLPILATTLLAGISTIAPDAIYVAYDLIDDMDALRRELETCLDASFIPDLIHIDDYHEKIFAGEMALVLQRLMSPAT